MTKITNWSVKMIKILIADDHVLIRKGLRELISETMDMVIAGEAEDYVALSNILKKKKN